MPVENGLRHPTVYTVDCIETAQLFVKRNKAL